MNNLDAVIQAYNEADKKFKQYKIANESFKSIINDLTNEELNKFMKIIGD
jgi:hypothetical protein